MKTALISPYPDITAFGLRLISGYLKENGHHTRMIFLPDPFGDDLVAGVQRYPDTVMDRLVELCADCDLVGMTLMTNFYDGAVQVTGKIKENLDLPVVWGGVHPTIRPDECLSHADAVCIGDGEEAVLQLAERIEKGIDYSDIPNLWVKKGGDVFRNAVAPLVRDLDTYPMPDYMIDDHHIMVDGRISPMTPDLLKQALNRGTVSDSLGKIGYQTMTGRGCPHKCSYCINDTIKTIYKGQRYLRWRSAAHVMEELLWVRENLPYVGFIWISDDAFLARGRENLKAFFKAYKEKIDLPFSCLASPLTVTDDIMAILVDAGLIYLQMGIESGSSRMQKLYNREKMTNERMMRAIRTINTYKHAMFPPSYDFILDTPYETAEDKIATLKFISRIPKPYHLQPFSLVLSPGTRLYEMAKKDGYVRNETEEIYGKTWVMKESNYFNLLIVLAKNGRLPAFLLKILISRPVVAVASHRAFKPLIRFVFKGKARMRHWMGRVMRAA